MRAVRLILRIAPALAEAAMASGVATRPIADIEAYRERLNEFVFRSGFIMKPLFAQAKTAFPTKDLSAHLEGRDKVSRCPTKSSDWGAARIIETPG
jgi:hypothetical protein